MDMRISASLSTAVFLAAGPAAALESALHVHEIAPRVQEKAPQAQKGLARPSRAASDPAEAAIARATSAAPPRLARDAAVAELADGKLREIRPGTNGWKCVLDLMGDSMCLDREWQAWTLAWTRGKLPPRPKAVGIAYMLNGHVVPGRVEPQVRPGTADNSWIADGPHVLILPTDPRQLEAYPSEPAQGGPWVMWKGSPYAHIMVPISGAPAKPPARR